MYKIMYNAKLILENGAAYEGIGYGAEENASGELVFNTSVTGYQEVITDPSYFGQIVIFTNPHIGNTGISNLDYEATTILNSGIITREVPSKPSSWRSSTDLQEFLKKNNKPAIAGLDTRNLTNIIRDNGSIFGAIVPEEIDNEVAIKLCLETKKKSFKYKNTNSLKSNYLTTNSKLLKIVIYGLGCKQGIINALKEKNCELFVLDTKDIIKGIKTINPDCIILSNGPGDPCDYKEEIEIIKTIIKYDIPVLGICLGHQLLAIAHNAEIEKLKYGHHGTNHPVLDIKNKKVFITSQNHNYTVSYNNIPKNCEITHTSLFDGTIQGIEFKKKLQYGFQGHPEGSPGPTDIDLFTQFLKLTTNKDQLNKNNIVCL
ncbi:MAG: glutamine-hydrolyzing carbamoyl-phosphate synthase small subunit [Bacteroidetes bacterium]|nr:glutamine-hydrolyzing carbamoyl-phosphate synthase small subunit [Bacteroidota bacterium]